MAEYRRLCAALEPPTPSQIEAFALYVADQHSWYKHLPLTPPGVPFVLFIDPGAGWQLFEHSDGRLSYAEIGADADLFHYSMLSTAEYRTRFGCLNVLQSHAPSFRLIGSEGSAHFGPAPGILTDHGFRAIPEALAQLGRVELNGSIHTLAGRDFLWRQYFWPDGAETQRSPDMNWPWPAESGGVRVLSRIRRLLESRGEFDSFSSNAFLARLIAPERSRQLRLLAHHAALVVEQAFGISGTVSALDRLFEQTRASQRLVEADIGCTDRLLWLEVELELQAGAWWILELQHDADSHCLRVELTRNPETRSVDLCLRFHDVALCQRVALQDDDGDADFLPGLVGVETPPDPEALRMTWVSEIWEMLVVLKQT